MLFPCFQLSSTSVVDVFLPCAAASCASLKVHPWARRKNNQTVSSTGAIQMGRKDTFFDQHQDRVDISPISTGAPIWRQQSLIALVPDRYDVNPEVGGLLKWMAPQESPTRVFRKGAQECPTKVSEQNASYKTVIVFFRCLFSSTCLHSGSWVPSCLLLPRPL